MKENVVDYDKIGAYTFSVENNRWQSQIMAFIGSILLFLSAIVLSSVFNPLDMSVFLWNRLGQFTIQTHTLSLFTKPYALFAVISGLSENIPLVLFSIKNVSFVLALLLLLYSGIRAHSSWPTGILSGSILLIGLHKYLFFSPELFSIVFFSFLMLELFNREIRPRHIALFIPIQIMWANTSPTAVLGPIIITLFFISALISIYVPLPFDMNRNILVPKHKLPALLLATIAVWISLFFSPSTFYIFAYLSALLKSTPHYNDALFYSGLFVGGLSIILNVRYNSIFNILLFVSLAIASFYLPLLYPFFFIASVHILNNCAEEQFNIGFRPVFQNIVRLICLIVLFIAFTKVIDVMQKKDFSFKTGKFATPVYRVPKDKLPSGILNYMRLIKYRGTLINTSALDGDYIYTEAYPRILPSRISFPFDENAYEKALLNADAHTLNSICQKQKIRAIFISNEDFGKYASLLLYLKKSGHWRLARLDINGALFLRSDEIKALPEIKRVSVPVMDPMSGLLLDPIQPRPILNMVLALINMREYNYAKNILNYINSIAPSPYGEYLYSRLLFEKGEYKKAWIHIRRAILSENGNDIFYGLAARILCRAGRNYSLKELPISADDMPVLSQVEFLYSKKQKQKAEQLIQEYIEREGLRNLRLNLLLQEIRKIQDYYGNQQV